MPDLQANQAKGANICLSLQWSSESVNQQLVPLLVCFPTNLPITLPVSTRRSVLTRSPVRSKATLFELRQSWK